MAKENKEKREEVKLYKESFREWIENPPSKSKLGKIECLGLVSTLEKTFYGFRDEDHSKVLQMANNSLRAATRDLGANNVFGVRYELSTILRSDVQEMGVYILVSGDAYKINSE